MKVEFYKHGLQKEDIDNCVKVLNSLFLTTGETVVQFEKKFAKFLGVNYAVGTNSCTNSLILALKCLGIKQGDEVITSPMSFVATSNAIEQLGAKPVFVDVSDETGNIKEDQIESAITKNTKVILPVHLYGQMCDMYAIRKIADKHKLSVIEDACHAIEAKRDGYGIGELSDFACFSFYATKNITSGEGGCVVTNNKTYAEWLKKARIHGINKDAHQRYGKSDEYPHYEMEFLGFKSNMSNIQAALLLAQIDRLPTNLQLREAICSVYDQAFEDHPLIAIPAVLKKSKHARHIYTIWVSPVYRDEMLVELRKKGVGCAVNYRAIHLMEYYAEKYAFDYDDFPIAEAIGDATITLPLYPGLNDKEINYVIRTVDQVVFILAEKYEELM